MQGKWKGALVALGTALAVSCLLPASAAMAQEASSQGTLRERLIERMREKRAEGGSEGGSPLADLLGGAGGDRSCAGRAGQTERLMARKPGPAPDIANVAYGQHRLQAYDVVRAGSSAGAPAGPAPVIVMVHGGGWCVGDKTMPGVVGEKLTRWQPRGFLFISVNYPMVNDGRDAYAQAEEVAQAVAHIQAHAADWGGDPARIVLMGHSAGAHLVTMLGADRQLRERFGVAPVLGVVSLDSGALNAVTKMQNPLPIMETVYREAFGADPAGWSRASPYHRLSAGGPPWLGVCSSTRPDDSCGEARAYADKARSLGLQASVIPVALNHGAVSGELGKPGAYTQGVEQFMASLDPALAARLR